MKFNCILIMKGLTALIISDHLLFYMLKQI